MMTAMARLPCKQQATSVTSSQQHQPRHNTNNNNTNHFNDGRAYWSMQQTSRQPVPPPYVRNPSRQHADNTGKRKSAVELLQESKAFYVKSEIVLDRKQELKNSGHLQVAPSTAPGAPPRLLRKCGNPVACTLPQQQIQQVQQLQQQQQQQQQQLQQLQQQQQPLQQNSVLSQLPNTASTPVCCWASCRDQDRPDGVLSPQRTLPPALPPKSPRLIPVPQRRAISGPPGPNGGDQLQTKLRRLLNTDSKENVFFPDNSPNVVQPGNGSLNRDHNAEKFRYSPGSPSAGCRDEDRTPHCNVPPDIRFKFGRSNSHSHSSGKTGRKSTTSPPTESVTAVCHKSLPDLHTSARRRASLSPRASTKSSSKPAITGGHHPLVSGNCPDCETSSDYSDRSFKRDNVCYRSSRHIRRSLGSGGGDASSVLSSGGRTQKSSGSSKVSHGATARDSGGSSGHCTHRSEPPPRIQDCWSHIRRDSGASTQHSTEKDRSRKGSYGSGTSASVVRNFSPDSESSNSQTDYSPTCNTRYSDGWKEGRGRPILRSKSDISDRYWRHENGRSKKVSNRSARSVTQFENFFDRLGLDTEHYELITEPNSKTSSPVFFDSVSSVDSALGLHQWTGNAQLANTGTQWQPNNCSTGMGNDEVSPRVSDPPSIVERNARIIKWLFQCRKVQFGYS